MEGPLIVTIICANVYTAITVLSEPTSRMITTSTTLTKNAMVNPVDTMVALRGIISISILKLQNKTYTSSFTIKISGLILPTKLELIIEGVRYTHATKITFKLQLSGRIYIIFFKKKVIAKQYWKNVSVISSIWSHVLKILLESCTYKGRNLNPYSFYKGNHFGWDPDVQTTFGSIPDKYWMDPRQTLDGF